MFAKVTAVLQFSKLIHQNGEFLSRSIDDLTDNTTKESPEDVALNGMVNLVAFQTMVDTGGETVRKNGNNPDDVDQGRLYCTMEESPYRIMKV